MIVKSFESDKIKTFTSNLILLHGSNQGHKLEIINNYLIKNFKGEIVKLEEQEVTNNKDNFISNLLTKSLFGDEKIIILSRVSDKIYNTIEEILEREIKEVKIILNSEYLDKKSKLRRLFEKEKNLICIPFYEDTGKSLNIIAINFFKEKKIKISQEILNLLIERARGDRNNLNNELIKLENLSFSKKDISIEDVIKLTNLAENYSVFELSENYLAKNKKKVTTILNENNYSSDECILILRTILNRLNRLLKLRKEVDTSKNIETVIANFNPPIFWKEKENVKKQIQSWSTNDVKKMIYKINDMEILIKKNSNNSVNLLSDFVINYQ